MQSFPPDGEAILNRASNQSLIMLRIMITDRSTTAGSTRVTKIITYSV